MRRIVAGEFMSLDGVVESPDKFVFPYFTDEVGQYVGSAIEASDTILMGRKLYDEWSAYWPGKTVEDDPFAGYINTMPKLVVSNTLKSPSWEGTTVISGDVKAEIVRLKQQPGKNIGMSGSPTLVQWLLGEGLLDELQLIVFPVVAASGRRLFQNTSEQVPLRLLDVRKLGDKGAVLLSYEPQKA